MALLILVLLVAAYVVNETIQYSHHNVGILGGDIIPIEDAPFMVSLRSNGEHQCGGSIIDKEFILTTAYCIKMRSIDRVVAGANGIEDIGEELKIQRVHNYDNSKLSQNNIALLKLEKPLKFGPKIQKVILPKNGIDVKNNIDVNITGWGFTTTYVAEYSKKLVQTSVKVLERSECKTGINEPMTINEFCSGSLERGACMGDGGGPVTVNGVQVGIMTRTSSERCISNIRNVNVAMYMTWIDSVINSDVKNSIKY